MYGGWTQYGVTHSFKISLSGTATTTGTFTLLETTASGSYTHTVSGYGIVSVVCP